MENEDRIRLHNLKPAPGSRKGRKRVGRGESAGGGKTCGRGQKGQKARGKTRPSFEGCLLYTSDAADDLLCGDLGGRRIIKKKKKNTKSNDKKVYVIKKIEIQIINQ